MAPSTSRSSEMPSVFRPLQKAALRSVGSLSSLRRVSSRSKSRTRLRTSKRPADLDIPQVPHISRPDDSPLTQRDPDVFGARLSADSYMREEIHANTWPRSRAQTRCRYDSPECDADDMTFRAVCRSRFCDSSSTLSMTANDTDEPCSPAISSMRSSVCLSPPQFNGWDDGDIQELPENCADNTQWQLTLAPSQLDYQSSYTTSPTLVHFSSFSSPKSKSHFSVDNVFSRSLSSYQFVGTLGRGTYGKVLLARFLEGELCAMKVLRKCAMTYNSVREVKRELSVLKFVAEGNMLERNQDDPAYESNSGNTRGVRFLQNTMACFQTQEHVFVSLEYHPTSLSHPEIMRRLLISSSLPTIENASISVSCEEPSSTILQNLHSLRILAAELLLGLDFLHRHAIVHQDLKPANIMISSSGHAVIVDFGAARSLPHLDHPEPASTTYFGGSSFFAPATRVYGPIVLLPQETVTFTPLYAAPELFRQRQDGALVYDERVDFWSLGIVLLEMATGSIPFEHDAEMQSSDPFAGQGREEKLDRKLDLIYARIYGLDEQFQFFLKQLLTKDVETRLFGDSAMFHPFFDSISHLWDDIADLNYPPLPNPSPSPVAEDISLDMDLVSSISKEGAHKAKIMQTEEIERLFQEANLRITWPLLLSDPSLRDDDCLSKQMQTDLSQEVPEVTPSTSVEPLNTALGETTSIAFPPSDNEWKEIALAAIKFDSVLLRSDNGASIDRDNVSLTEIPEVSVPIASSQQSVFQPLCSSQPPPKLRTKDRSSKRLSMAALRNDFPLTFYLPRKREGRLMRKSIRLDTTSSSQFHTFFGDFSFGSIPDLDFTFNSDFSVDDNQDGSTNSHWIQRRPRNAEHSDNSENPHNGCPDYTKTSSLDILRNIFSDLHAPSYFEEDNVNSTAIPATDQTILPIESTRKIFTPSIRKSKKAKQHKNQRSLGIAGTVGRSLQATVKAIGRKVGGSRAMSSF